MGSTEIIVIVLCIKNIHFFTDNQSALQVIAYFDELEICNPLGSITKIYKVGVFLFTLGNLPPKYLKCLLVCSS